MASQFPGMTAMADIPVRAALGEVRTRRGSRSVLVLLASRAFVEGALDLLYVVIAIEVLGGSGADAGWLNTAYGAGALVGASASIVLVGRRSLWPAGCRRAVTVVALRLGAVTRARHRRGVRRDRCRDVAVAHREPHAAAARDRPAVALPRVLARRSGRHDDVDRRQPEHPARRRGRVAAVGGRGDRSGVPVGRRVADPDRRGRGPPGARAARDDRAAPHRELFACSRRPRSRRSRAKRARFARAGNRDRQEGEPGAEFYACSRARSRSPRGGQVLRTCRRGTASASSRCCSTSRARRPSPRSRTRAAGDRPRCLSRRRDG